MPAQQTLIEQVERDGFAVVPDVLSPESCDELLAAFAFVQNAAENRAASMRNVLQRAPLVRVLCESPLVLSLMETFLGIGCFPVRAILFDKTADTNWKVVWHQDLTIAVQERREVEGFGPWSVKDGVTHVQPPERVLEQMLTLRLHLDDCDDHNGPLRVLRGSHKSGKLSSSAIAEWRTRQAEEVCTSPRGGALLMRPLLLHASSQAKKPRHRRVLHIEWANEKLPGGLRWHNRNEV